MKEIKDKVIEELRPILTRYQVEGKKEKDKIIAIDSEKLPGLLKVNNYRISQVEEKKYENNYEGELLQKLDEEADLSIRRAAIEELKELRRSEREKAEKNLSDLENETQKECARVIDRIREELKAEIETKKQKLEEVQKAKKQYVSERINIRAIYKQCKPESRIFRAATEDEQEIISKIKEEHKKINELENQVNSSTNTLKAFEEEYGKIDLQNDMSQLINIVLESMASSSYMLSKKDELHEEIIKEENRKAARRRIEENREARKRIQEDRQKAAERRQDAEYRKLVIETIEKNLDGNTNDEQRQYLMKALTELDKSTEITEEEKKIIEKEVRERLENLTAEKTQEDNTTKPETTTIDIQQPKAQVKTEPQIKPKTIKVEEPETKVTSTPVAQTKKEPKTEMNGRPLDVKEQTEQDENDMPISIMYQAKKDRYIVKDANRAKGIIAQTKKIKVIDKSVLAEELQIEEQDLNYLDLNIVSVLRKLDERNGTDRAEQYINNILDPKNKDENMQVSYDLRGLFRNKEISQENRKNHLECADYVKTFGLGNVKKGLGTIIGEKVSNIMAQFKNRNLKQIEAPIQEKLTRIKKNNFKKETEVTSTYQDISKQIKRAYAVELEDILEYAQEKLKEGKISTTEYSGIMYNIEFRKNEIKNARKEKDSQAPDLNIVDLDNEDIEQE